jgi:hypothetical protein
MYIDDQVLLALTDDDLQTAVPGVYYILKACNLQISESKPKAMGMQGNTGEELK